MKHQPAFFMAVFNHSVIVVALLLSLIATPMHASVKLASFFSDHMVLQRDRKICIWGIGDANASVEVSIASQRVSTVVATNGSWKVYLEPMVAGGPYILTASLGKNTNTINDVLYGDIWLCSGQSNMQFPVKESAASEQESTPAHRPQLRLCTVSKTWKAEPQSSADIMWQVCTPESARDFSAVAYYFACQLLQDPALANVPIGVIDSSFGGTTCEGWIPQTALAGFDPKILHNSMFGIKPSMLYNAMIAPLGNTPIKGVVWYQGESNSAHPDTYPRLLSTLIAEWRKQFNTPDLPFFIVQLPDYASQWEGFYWPWEREAQAQVAKSVSNTTLAVGIETTDGFNLHPKQKLEIARRTAFLVRRDVYNENIVASGPTFKAASVEGATIRVTFDASGNHLASRSTNNEVRGFAVAGDDGIYRFANARIDGESVIVHCDQVPAPKTVRYAWTGVPDSTLVNEAGLPAAPFRTDDFPYSNVEVQKEPVSHQVTTSAYEIRLDGNGQVTSLAVRGAQFLSNEPGMAGGTSIPAKFGQRSLPDIQNLGSELLSCSDGSVTFMLQFKETDMVWTITNPGKDEIEFNIALSSQVAVNQLTNSEPLTLIHKRSSLTISGINSVSDSENGKVLQVVVKGKSSRQLVLNMSGI
jgi:sialate O-acetylesterase